MRPAAELLATELSAGEDGERGGKADVPVCEIRGAVNAPREDAPSNKANAAPAVSAPARRSAAHAVTGQQLQGVQMLLRSLGGVPDAMINSSSVDVMSTYLQGRMQSAIQLSAPMLGARAECQCSVVRRRYCPCLLARYIVVGLRHFHRNKHGFSSDSRIKMSLLAARSRHF